MKSLKKALVIGEKHIFRELIEVISLAEKANVHMRLMLGLNNDALGEHTEGIRMLEKQADEISFRVREDITTGAVSPNIIDNLIELVGLADDIVDMYYYLSREISRMSKSEFPYSEALKQKQSANLFKSLTDLAGASLAKVKAILSASDWAEIVKIRKQIEAIEEQGDDLKDEGLDWLYHEAPNMHYLEYYHYTEMLHKFDDILDACEDSSDLIASIITSILK